MYFLVKDDRKANFNNAYARKYFMFSDLFFSFFHPHDTAPTQINKPGQKGPKRSQSVLQSERAQIHCLALVRNTSNVLQAQFSPIRKAPNRSESERLKFITLLSWWSERKCIQSL